jgi:hypothetical protein
MGGPNEDDVSTLDKAAEIANTGAKKWITFSASWGNRLQPGNMTVTHGL